MTESERTRFCTVIIVICKELLLVFNLHDLICLVVNRSFIHLHHNHTMSTLVHHKIIHSEHFVTLYQCHHLYLHYYTTTLQGHLQINHHSFCSYKLPPPTTCGDYLFIICQKRRKNRPPANEGIFFSSTFVLHSMFNRFSILIHVTLI